MYKESDTFDSLDCTFLFLTYMQKMILSLTGDNDLVLITK